jgi:hypothetical protein
MTHRRNSRARSFSGSYVALLANEALERAITTYGPNFVRLIESKTVAILIIVLKRCRWFAEIY